MAELDTRRWSLRDPSAEISNHNIPTAMLVRWAREGIIKPGFTLSTDGETWVPAETLPELGMAWYVIAAGSPPYGPIAREAAERLIRDGHFPADALLSQDPGEEPVSTELPFPVEPVVDVHAQELEETRKRLVLLEKELRLKDRRIDELRQEAEARQEELNVEGLPDAATLSRELESLRLEFSHLKLAAQEAAEAASLREREQRQRIHTLETALEAAQERSPAAAQPPNEALYAVLAHEAEWLRHSQDEEQRFLEQLRELTRQRVAQHAERMLEIRKLAGENPEEMVERALRNQRVAMISNPLPRPIRREEATPLAELEKALAEARARESELQRQLVAQEGREAQLRAQVGQAERRTLDALQLDEKLRETVQALGRERTAREEEHRENAHIQEQLLRRIEELERLTAQVGMSAAPARTFEPPPDEPPRASFGWLRKH